MGGFPKALLGEQEASVLGASAPCRSRIFAGHSEEVRDWYAESEGNPFDVVDGNVACLTLDMSDERAM